MRRRTDSVPFFDTALCVGDENSPREWVEILPARDSDGRITTIDGRWWTLDPEEFVRRSAIPEIGLVIDYEHATDRSAKRGFEAPATGWIHDLEIRDDGIVWARVEWTPRGEASIRNKEYKRISATFAFDPARRAIRLLAGGLTNRPAFTSLAALASESEENVHMNEKQLAELRSALGLEETATPEEITAAASKRGGDPGQRSIDDFIPRADYDAAMARAQAAEAQLAAASQQARDAEIEETVSRAIADGKIAPASKDYHQAACAIEGGLDRFRAMVDAAPSISQPSGAGTSQPPTGGGRALTQEEIEVARAMGLTDDQMREVA